MSSFFLVLGFGFHSFGSTFFRDISCRLVEHRDVFLQRDGTILTIWRPCGLDDTMAKRIAAGFGGGMGRMRMMCGAVSGIVMLVGLDCGQTEGSDSAGKSACYKVVQELLAKSTADNGSLICAELLGLKGPVPLGQYVASERTAEYYKSRPCADKVESAARIFAQYLDEKP